jgi:hypothetical protein
VSGPALDDLAHCVASLDLAASSRTDALPDVVILTYAPGLELEARFVASPDGPWLNWIGYVARRDAQDALPTVSAGALEALRVEGDSQAPLAGPGAFDELGAAKTAHAWLKVCIDSAGAITGVHVREASSPKAARVFSAAAETWKFRPFTLRGQPTPVCSMVQMRYPADATAREMLPLPLPAVAAFTNVPSGAVGKPLNDPPPVTPSGSEKLWMQHSGVYSLLGAVHFCIDETGRVNHVALIRSTGLPVYDRNIVGAVQQWSYAPYLDEGKPVGVCSSVAFLYRQIGTAQGPPITWAR